jgi:hypothetical protein
VSRYDAQAGRWQSFSTKDGLASDVVNAIATGADGAVWFGSSSWSLLGRPVSFYQPTSDDSGFFVSLSVDGTERKLVIGQNEVVLTRPTGLCFIAEKGKRLSPDPVRAYPPGATASALASGPAGRVWVGTTIEGLVLQGPSGVAPSQIMLSSPSVTGIAPVPGTDGATVWVGTLKGASRVHAASKPDGNYELQVERTVSEADGLLPGRVDAAAVADDGDALLAFNAAPNLARARTETAIWRVPANPSETVERWRVVEVESEFRSATVKTMAWGKDHTLWIGTSAGLYRGQAGTISRETAHGRLPPVSVSTLVVAPDDFGTVWMAVDVGEGRASSVLGYKPKTDEIYSYGERQGVPSSRIDDLAFTSDGELVVLSGSILTRGVVFVPGSGGLWPALLLVSAMALLVMGGLFVFGSYLHPLGRAVRTEPRRLRSLPLADGATALRRLRLIGERGEVWRRLELPAARLPLVGTLAGSRSSIAIKLQALARMLRAETGDAACAGIASGLWGLPIRLTSVVALKEQRILLLGLDLERARKLEVAELRTRMERALETAGQRNEDPYLLLCPSGAAPKDALPRSRQGLMIGQPELRQLLFSRDPSGTLAGYLLTRGLLRSLSPYATTGAVGDEAMFFGREQLVSGVLTAAVPKYLIVGPRRVGKTSLLLHLERKLRARHRDRADVVFLDLWGVRDEAQAAQRLRDKLNMTDVGAGPEAEEGRASFVEILRRRRRAVPERDIFLLIDEFDLLAEADAKKGYPLLGAMRSLQAERGAAFVLAGFEFLFKESMDQRSPLFNFADVHELGPLTGDAARGLVVEPMARLGVDYESDHISTQIVIRTGGYPSVVQHLCAAILGQITGETLTITAAALEVAERSQNVTNYLRALFEGNTSAAGRLIATRMVARDSFKAADVRAALGDTPLSENAAQVDTVLRQLRLSGFVAQDDSGTYRWAVPLLRDALRKNPYDQAILNVVLRQAQDANFQIGA